jgi:flagellar motility protein MotE (MotC chaperone)
MANKKKSMTREDAAELYRDLQKAMNSVKGKPAAKKNVSVSGIDAKAIAESIKAAMRREDSAAGDTTTTSTSAQKSAISTATAVPTSAPMLNRGQYTAICCVLLFAGFKVVLSGMEASGFATATPVEASYIAEPRIAPVSVPGTFTKEEVKVLTALDGRRAELEDRNKRLDDRQSDLDKRDREFATRLTQLRELTEKLSIERDKGEKKRSGQLDQLANVYGSMNPPEAAALIEQLDVQIALPLLERMPEKRIGQILALMSPERALSITRMLSSRIQ